ncbi:MAG: Gldg family protein, partial [Planctomycetes bacterium]|nr:Gldg family protein [Planctomycetota bacterium]
MATETPNRSKPLTAAGDGGMTQTRRWLVFGSNVALAVVLATILAGVVVWLSGALLRGRTRSDWTATGRFSLSQRSRNLLTDLPCDVTLTNLYSHAPEVPASEEQWQRVQDLLAEYGMASPKVTVEAVNPAVDAAAVEKLVDRLRQRYADELEKPRALVGQFGQMREDVDALLAQEAKRLAQVADAWKDGPPDAAGALRMVSQRWQQLKVLGEFTSSAIQGLTDQALPAYTTALTRAKEYLKQVRENFAAVPDLRTQVRDLVKDAPLPENVKAFLDDTATYPPMIQRIEAFEKEAAETKETGLDAVRRDIAEGEVVLIETFVPKGVIRVAGGDRAAVT